MSTVKEINSRLLQLCQNINSDSSLSNRYIKSYTNKINMVIIPSLNEIQRLIEVAKTVGSLLSQAESLEKKIKIINRRISSLESELSSLYNSDDEDVYDEICQIENEIDGLYEEAREYENRMEVLVIDARNLVDSNC